MSLRLPSGGRLIDRAQPLEFTFNGRRLTGYAGDTLASALLGAGHVLVGRSFKYHRPRGVVASGAEEPNALMNLGEGARMEPNQRATSPSFSKASPPAARTTGRASNGTWAR
jgi:sarcosine oxidase, subunit alpha